MRFGILGPTQVRHTDGREVTVGGPRLRTLLALLLVDPGKVVSAERLIDGLYGGDPPGDAANALQSQVSRLRQLLRDQDRPGSPVELHPAGYRLAVEADDVDVHRFERLAVEGRRALVAGDQPRAATLLREALGLWRGPALADVGEVPFAKAAGSLAADRHRRGRRRPARHLPGAQPAGPGARRRHRPPGLVAQPACPASHPAHTNPARPDGGCRADPRALTALPRSPRQAHPGPGVAHDVRRARPLRSA